MAEAPLHKGRAIVAYKNGEAIDSEGAVIEGAPKASKDTDPSEQPGALGAPSAEERMGIAIASAILNPKAMAAKGGANVGAGVAAKPVAHEAGYQTSAAHAPEAGSDSVAASQGEEVSSKSARKRAGKRAAKKA